MEHRAQGGDEEAPGAPAELLSLELAGLEPGRGQKGM